MSDSCPLKKRAISNSVCVKVNHSLIICSCPQCHIWVDPCESAAFLVRACDWVLYLHSRLLWCSRARAFDNRHWQGKAAAREPYRLLEQSLITPWQRGKREAKDRTGDMEVCVTNDTWAVPETCMGVMNLRLGWKLLAFIRGGQEVIMADSVRRLNTKWQFDIERGFSLQAQTAIIKMLCLLIEFVFTPFSNIHHEYETCAMCWFTWRWLIGNEQDRSDTVI